MAVRVHLDAMRCTNTIEKKNNKHEPKINIMKNKNEYKK